MIELSGVLSSCDIIAMKSVLARLTRTSSSFCSASR